MPDARKTKKQLIEELDKMRQRVSETQAAEFKLQAVADALRQSEIQFGKITEKSIVGVYLIQDDVFKYVNPNMAEICGYSVDEMVERKGPQDVVSDEDWPIVRENLRKRIAGELDSIHYCFRGKRPGGEMVHLECYGSRMDYCGRPAVIGTLLDITQRVRAERELEMQLKRFQALYHLAVAMTAEHSLEENLALLVDESLELLEADAALIAVEDQKTGRLRVCGAAGCSSERLYGLELPLAPVLGNRKSSKRRGRSLEKSFIRLKRSGKSQSLVHGLVSGIAASVMVRERELGILCVGSKMKRSFTDSQRNLLSLLANMAALEINRKQAEEALAKSEDQLRLLSRQLLGVQEDERKRVAQDLHDGIGQSLTAMKFEVEAVVRKASKSVPAKHLAPIKSLVPMIQHVVEEVGRIAMDLRPSILDDLGIHATISWLCREFGRTHPKVRVERKLEMDESQVPERHKIVIFRILQEALNNVAKHSAAKKVQVSLHKQNSRIELTVQDDGIGFDWDFSGSPAGNERGFGLASMKERAQLSGGSFSVKTSRRNGTVIVVRWPDN